MPTQVLMPQLGESVDEGTVTQWLKAVGDRVEEYEPLLEVNTDKVDTEVPSPAAGILLEILVEPDTTVKAGTLLAIIGAAGEGGPLRAPTAAASPPPLNAEPPAPPSPAALPAPSAGRDRVLGFISPIVAKLASEHQVDLSRVPGTGEGGRITKQDVLAFVHTAAAAPQTAPAPAPPPPPNPPAPLPRYYPPAPPGKKSCPSPACAARLLSTWCTPSTPPRTSPPLWKWT